MMSSAPDSSHASRDQPPTTASSHHATSQRTAKPTAVTSHPGAIHSEDADASSTRLTTRTGKSQRSSAQMDSTGRGLSYTRTGRISKAKKGIKDAHACACGKSYSRAEHLRRHQQNHGETLYCSYQDCDKTFHREDLLRRHERNHETGSAMETLDSRSPSVAYTNPSTMDGGMSSSISMAATPVFSPAQTPATMTSQPTTPFNDPSTVMSAPRYTVSQFNQFRRLSQPAQGFSFAQDANLTRTMGSNGLGLSMPSPMTLPPQSGLVQTDLPPHGTNLSNPSNYSGVAYDTIWPNAYSQPYVPSHTPLITSNESWPTAAAIHGGLGSPASTVAVPQYWYEKTVPGVDSSLAMSYPMDLHSVMPTASETVSPYIPYATTAEWDQVSAHSMTPVTVKAELSSPIALAEGQPLSAALNIYAKPSYIEAYWEYMHPLYPILHKPTVEQQRHLDQQQSSSDMLLEAAIVICGAAHTKEQSRWADGRLLLKKALQHAEQEQFSLAHDLKAMQALFLIEAYAQYHSQRAPTQYSKYFNSVVNQLQQDVDVRSAAARPTHMASAPMDEQLSHQWAQWTITHGKQRLLVACSGLMMQTAIYLRTDANLPQLAWQDLTLPCSMTLWNASTAAQWQSLLTVELPSYTISEAIVNLPNLPALCLDQFQSIIVSTAYATMQQPDPAVVEALQLAVPLKPAVQLLLHANLLAQNVPLRALLAVAGESWTPSGGRLAMNARVAADILGHMKTALRTWVSRAFVPLSSQSAPTSQPASVMQQAAPDNATHASVRHALTTLRIASQLEEQDRALPLAGEIAIYIATLVLWALGHEAMRRCLTGQFANITPPASGASDFTSASSARQGLAAFVGAAESGLLARVCSAELDADTALQWRQGVDAAMRWTRLRVGGFVSTPAIVVVGSSSLHHGGFAPESSIDAAARRRSHSMPPQMQPSHQQQQPQQHAHFSQQALLGELNAGFINVLRRLEARGWVGAWF